MSHFKGTVDEMNQKYGASVSLALIAKVKHKRKIITLPRIRLCQFPATPERIVHTLYKAPFL